MSRKGGWVKYCCSDQIKKRVFWGALWSTPITYILQLFKGLISGVNSPANCYYGLNSNVTVLGARTLEKVIIVR